MMTNDWNIPGSPLENWESIFVPALVAEWVPQVRALADPGSGERALDVACGTGALTRSLAEAVGQSGYVAGADLNPQMLTVARRVSIGRFPAIDWRLCPAHSLPFADESFDVAYCQLSLMLMTEQAATLKEMRRVMKSAGRLGIMVWGAMDKCPGHSALAMTWERRFNLERSANIHRVHSLGDPGLVRSLLEEAGFEEISVAQLIGAARFESAEHMARSYGALFRIPADEQQQAATIQDVNLLMADYMGGDGLVFPIEAVLASGRKG